MAATSVILFKNGYSFVSVPVQLGEGAGEEGAVEECAVGPLPAFAVHGTISLQPGREGGLELLSLARREREQLALELPEGERPSMVAFLRANLGSLVRVAVAEGREGARQSMHEGRVRWVQDGEEAGLAVLEVQQGAAKRDKLISCSGLVSVERQPDSEENEVSLVARFRRTGPAAPSAVLSYLTRGLAWAPAYSLLLDRQKMTLRLEGCATILCDLPFFDGSPVGTVSLVAGQPRVQLEQLCDPLVSGAGAEDFIHQLEEALPGPGRPDAPRPLMRKANKGRNAAFGYGAAMERGACMAEMDSNEMGWGGGQMDQVVDQTVEGIKGTEVVEDFFHYQLESVPLRRNQPVKMAFIRPCEGVKYEDVYFLDLDQRVRQAGGGGEEENSVEVKHAVSFQNPAGPLAAGPVSVLAREENEGGRFLVQGLLAYTPPDRPVIVEMTRALDIQVPLTLKGVSPPLPRPPSPWRPARSGGRSSGPPPSAGPALVRSTWM
jgi:hypothetical protein